MTSVETATFHRVDTHTVAARGCLARLSQPSSSLHGCPTARAATIRQIPSPNWRRSSRQSQSGGPRSVGLP